MNRRNFLRTSSLTAAAAPAAAAVAATRVFSDGQPTIDTNVYLGEWPFRQLPVRGPKALAKKLGDAGITKAWVGHFDALLHRDLDAVNARLAAACRGIDGRPFLPFGCVNPMQPGWKETLRRCHEVHRMSGLRLHPNYHGYTLEAPEFRELLAEAQKRELTVQIAVRMEDPRTQHPKVVVSDVVVDPLVDVLGEFKGKAPRVQLLNALRSVRSSILLQRLSERGVHFEIAMLEGAAALESLGETIPAKQVEFGSYAPFFYLEAALLKLAESDIGSAEIALRCHNAENLLCGIGV